MKPKLILSDQNQSFKDLRRLLTARGIREQGLALMAGDKVIPEVAAQYASRVAAWITREGVKPPAVEAPWTVLETTLFAVLDQFGTDGPMAVVTVPTMPAWSDAAPWPKGCTLFLALQNPENLGAVIRSATAFGVSRIVLLKEAAHPFHPKAMRAAGTALLGCDFLTGPAIADLQVTSVPLLALDAHGVALAKTKFPESFALLPGVEGPGLPADRKGMRRLSIPMQPGVESLNAATATAIALYEWRR